MINEIEDRIIKHIDSQKDEIIFTAKEIWNYKELGMKEFRSSQLLMNMAKKHGFETKSNIAGLETAFKASYNKNKGRYKIAFLAEYDALPYIGHGCGHNLIAASSLGSAIGLSKTAEELDLEVYLFGTPAEESIGGKIIMHDEGCFDNIDFIMMCHPSGINAVYGNSLAISSYEVEFRGKPSHASADPFCGANALDGIISLYNNLAMLRQQLRRDARIHFIIKEGGYAVNIIPEKTVGEVALRAKDREYLKELEYKFNTLLKASANATFTQSRAKLNMPVYYEMIQNPVLAETFIKTAEDFGINKFEYRSNAGSVDIGNISHDIPALHAYLNILENPVPGHSKEFANAAISHKGLGTMLLASKIMAITSIRIISDPMLFNSLNC